MLGQKPVFQLAGNPKPKPAVLAPKTGERLRERTRRAYASGKIKTRVSQQLLDIGREFLKP